MGNMAKMALLFVLLVTLAGIVLAATEYRIASTPKGSVLEKGEWTQTTYDVEINRINHEIAALEQQKTAIDDTIKELEAQKADLEKLAGEVKP
jgi:predicted  nucleic acid-binding Zn-ribbon protein